MFTFSELPDPSNDLEEQDFDGIDNEEPPTTESGPTGSQPNEHIILPIAPTRPTRGIFLLLYF